MSIFNKLIVFFSKPSPDWRKDFYHRYKPTLEVFFSQTYSTEVALEKKGKSKQKGKTESDAPKFKKYHFEDTDKEKIIDETFISFFISIESEYHVKEATIESKEKTKRLLDEFADNVGLLWYFKQRRNPPTIFRLLPALKSPYLSKSVTYAKSLYTAEEDRETFLVDVLMESIKKTQATDTEKIIPPLASPLPYFLKGIAFNKYRSAFNKENNKQVDVPEHTTENVSRRKNPISLAENFEEMYTNLHIIDDERVKEENELQEMMEHCLEVALNSKSISATERYIFKQRLEGASYTDINNQTSISEGNLRKIMQRLKIKLHNDVKDCIKKTS